MLLTAAAVVRSDELHRLIPVARVDTPFLLMFTFRHEARYGFDIVAGTVKKKRIVKMNCWYLLVQLRETSSWTKCASIRLSVEN